jgi:Fe-S oxidoreductase
MRGHMAATASRRSDDAGAATRSGPGRSSPSKATDRDRDAWIRHGPRRLEVHWWGHMTVILGFLNYLPFSKHIHVLGSGPNILLRDQGQRMVMPKLELFDGAPDDPDAAPKMENWGVGKIEDFSWKSLLDNYACTECARCTTYCPAFATGKPLSPMHLIHDLKDEMKERGFRVLDSAVRARRKAPRRSRRREYSIPTADEDHPQEPSRAKRLRGAREDPRPSRRDRAQARADRAPPLVGGRIKDETLWACTTCGACQEVCPVFIEHPLKILQMRSTWCSSTRRRPRRAERTFRNIERAGQPVGHPQRRAHGVGERARRADDRGQPRRRVPPVRRLRGRVRQPTSSSRRARDGAGARAAGVDYAVLGHQEGCTGDTGAARRQRDAFQMLAEQNVETLNERRGRRRSSPAARTACTRSSPRLPAVRRHLRGRPPHPADRPPDRERQAQASRRAR